MIEINGIPDSCMHGDRARVVKPLPGCQHCSGSGRVDYFSDEYSPGTNACCCTCGSCRTAAAKPSARSGDETAHFRSEC